MMNENIQSLVKSTIDLITKYKHILGDMGKSVVSMMIKDHEKFIVEVSSQSKNLFYEEIIIEDLNWDKRLKKIKQTIEAGIKSDDEKKKIAAHNLDFFLTQYSSLNCSILYPHKYLQLEMFRCYHADKDLQKSAQLIGIDYVFVELEAINANFITPHESKIEEAGEQLNELVKKERTETINSYSLFCTYMEETASLSTN
jgi:hypothetical protein